MAGKKKSPYIALGITPLGVAVFPHLTKPDTKFKAEGEYHVKLRLGGAEAVGLKSKVDEMYDVAIERILDEKSEGDAAERKKLVKTMKKADKPYKEVLDKEGDPTGEIEFTFKQKAKVTINKGKANEETIEKKVDLFDAAKKPLPKGTDVWGGSKIKVAFGGLPFFTPAVGAGLTLRLQAAQVIELRSGGERDADSYGFDEEGEGLTPRASEGGEESGEGTSGSDGESNPDF